MRAESWIKQVLLTIARQTPDYRTANLDWRWNLQTDRASNIVRRSFGAMIGVLTAGVTALSLGAVGLAQATGREPTVHVGTASAPASAVTGSAYGTLPGTTGAARTGGVAIGGSGGGFSSMLIVMGAILVLLGIGAIALILWRRKDDGGPLKDDEPRPARRGPRLVPANRKLRSAVESDASHEVEP
jgi:hypothetical protein